MPSWMRKPPSRGLFFGGVAILVFARSPHVESQVHSCANLNGQVVHVGAARVDLQGTDFGYANAYADNGTELKIPTGAILGVLGAMQPLGAVVSAYVQDKDNSDCGVMTVRLDLHRSGSSSLGQCTQFSLINTALFSFNSCDGLDENFVGAGEAGVFNITRTSAFNMFRSVVSAQVDGINKNVDNDDCWTIEGVCSSL